MLDKDLNFIFNSNMIRPQNQDLFFCFVEHKESNNFHKSESFRAIAVIQRNLIFYLSNFIFPSHEFFVDQRSIFIFVIMKKKKKKIKQRKNYVYRDWKSGKIAIGFSYISFTRTHAHSLSLSLSLSLLILLFNFLFHSLFFLFFSTFFSHFIFPPLLLTPSFVPRYSSLSLSLPSFSSHLSLLGSG